MSIKGISVKHDKLTPEFNKVAAWEESEDDSDEANALDQAYTLVSSALKVESEGCLPGNLHSARLRPTHHMCMESKESSGADNDDRVGDYARQWISKDKTEIKDDKEMHTTTKSLDNIRRHEAIEAYKNVSSIPEDMSQLLDDHSKL